MSLLLLDVLNRLNETDGRSELEEKEVQDVRISNGIEKQVDINIYIYFI